MLNFAKFVARLSNAGSPRSRKNEPDNTCDSHEISPDPLTSSLSEALTGSGPRNAQQAGGESVLSYKG